MIALSGISGVSGAATAELMKILEANQQATMDLAEKMVKVAVGAKVAESEATGLGKAVDLMPDFYLCFKPASNGPDATFERRPVSFSYSVSLGIISVPESFFMSMD